MVTVSRHLSQCALPRPQELQRCDSERRGKEKERTECSLQIKELEHKIAKFLKDSRDATNKVCVCVVSILKSSFS